MPGEAAEMHLALGNLTLTEILIQHHIQVTMWMMATLIPIEVVIPGQVRVSMKVATVIGLLVEVITQGQMRVTMRMATLSLGGMLTRVQVQVLMGIKTLRRVLMLVDIEGTVSNCRNICQFLSCVEVGNMLLITRIIFNCNVYWFESF
jgi:hypothetical protein